MITKAETIKNYNVIEEDIKFIPKSLLRMEIINHLHKTPSSMSEINNQKNINYSAISTNIHYLELNDYIFRKDDKYHLSNVMMNYLCNLKELNDIIGFIDDFFYFFHNHSIQGISSNYLLSLNYLINSKMIENDDLYVYKSYDFIITAIKEANFIKGILPFYQDDVNDVLKNLSKSDVMINLLIPSNLEKNFNRTFNTCDNNINFEFFDYNTFQYFLLIYTDKVMILGLFKNDGNYDQNRLLTSKNNDALIWSENLFTGFKNKIKESV